MEHKNCTGCGQCCGPVVATKGEIATIKRFVKHHISKATINRLKSQSPNSSNCPYHDEHEKKCTIYPVRPEICRMFGLVKGLNCPNGNTRNDIAQIDLRKKRTLLPDFIGYKIGWV
jgi:Predicted Fe-S-cluster oxidoreductase